MIAQKANIESNSDLQTKKTVLDYGTIFNKAPIGLEYYDQDGILIDINETALRIYGCTDKEHLLATSTMTSICLKRKTITSIINVPEKSEYKISSNL